MKQLFSLSFLFIGVSVFAQNNYKVANTYHIASAGGWDYISVNQGKIYASHGTQVNILNEANASNARPKMIPGTFQVLVVKK